MTEAEEKVEERKWDNGTEGIGRGCEWAGEGMESGSDRIVEEVGTGTRICSDQYKPADGRGTWM